MSDRELMQQALDALEDCDEECGELGKRASRFLRKKACESLRARLAEPDDEPRRVFIVATGETHNGEETYTRHDDAPPPLCDAECLYTRPSARKVQPLTDEQIDAEVFPHGNFPFLVLIGEREIRRFARAIERAHGITGDSHD